MKQVSSIFLLLFWLLILSNTAYGKSQDAKSNHSKSKPFEILYYEEIPEISLQEQAAQSVAHSTQTSSITWLFEAFGKSFQVLLHPNTRLIAKMSQRRQTQLQNNLKVYRGTLEGISNSWVRLTRSGQQWSGMIWDGQEAYIIDSLSVVTPALQTVPPPTASEHSIYRISDTRDLGNRTCGMGDQGGIPTHPMTSFGALVEELEDRVGITAQGATRNIDMAVVTDQEFNNANSNPNAAVVARMNVVDGIFSEQLGVQISLVDVLPLQNNGGLTATSAGTLLNQFSQFTNSASFDHPGVAHLFTGRNLNGSTVGIAFFRSVCSARFGIGIDQITGTGTAGALTVAHELGHNFGAPHDNESGSPCATTPGTFLMNPSLNGSDEFSPCSISQVQPIVNNASCITFIELEQADLVPRFQNTPQEAPSNQPFSSVLSITNNGLASGLNTRAEISIPNGLSLENVITSSGSCTGIGTNQAICTFSTIPPGNRRDITLTLNAASAGSFTLLATVSTDNETKTGDNTIQGTITITGGGSFPPSLAAPTPGTALTMSTITFTGGHTGQDYQHWAYVGSTPNGTDLYRGAPNRNHQFTVSSLPSSGTIYVRYYTRTSNTSAWQSQTHSYTMNVGGGDGGGGGNDGGGDGGGNDGGGGGNDGGDDGGSGNDGGGSFPPSLAAPTPGTALTMSTITFTGGHTSQDYQHWAYVGSTPNGTDLYRGAPNRSHQFTVSNLPSSGTIYVRYYTRTSNTSAWQSLTHSYTMNVGGGDGGGDGGGNDGGDDGGSGNDGGGSFPPSLAAPTPGTALTTSTVTFTGGHTGQDYQHWAYVGSTPNGTDLYRGAPNRSHQFTVSNLPSSGTIYVRYYTRTSNTSAWQSLTHSYTMNVDGN